MRLPRVKLKLRHLVALIAVVAVGLCLDSCQVAIWDGAFPLQVDLQDRKGRSIVGVAAQPCGRIEEAEYFLANPNSPELRLEDVHWATGQPFEVRVPCSGRSTMLGRELSYYQFKALLLRVDYADGTGQLLSVGIPNGRVWRRVSVQIP